MAHSLHGYFLRPGRFDHHVILRVARDRDGRSFSARHVVAIQQGEVIFSMSASFHTPRPGDAYELPRPPVPEIPPEPVVKGMQSRFDDRVDIRPVAPLVAYRPDQVPVPARMWVKTRESLPDDPMTRACVLAYISDIGSGFGDGQAGADMRGGPSVDHAMWFQDDIPADDWVYLDTWPVKAGGSRGLYSGSIHGIAGGFGAMLTQEILFRPAPAAGPAEGA